MSYPPTQTLTSEEKDLIWKFRFYLTRDKRVYEILYTIRIHSIKLYIYIYILGIDKVFKVCCLDGFYRSETSGRFITSLG